MESSDQEENNEVPAADEGDEDGAPVFCHNEEPSDEVPTETPKVKPSKKPASSKSGRQKRSASRNADTRNADILQAFIETEKMAAKRERKREKARDRREKRQMTMLFTLATTAITAFGGAVKPSVVQAAQETMEASDGSSTSEYELILLQ